MDVVWEYDGIVIIFDCMVIVCYDMLILNNKLSFSISVFGLSLIMGGSLVSFMKESIFDFWEELKDVLDVVLLLLVYVKFSKYMGWVIVFVLLLM